MSKLKLSALLLGAALFLSLGTTSLLAESKCGTSAKSENSCDKKCDKDCEKGVKCKHEDKCDCKIKKASSSMKCGTGKCGGNTKPANTGKCGSK